MSINVTVSGNPVRINRGKMVTSYDPAKREFDKRRLMRLEQVRQQSKDIAENIRNKLKKDKSKHLSEVEREGEVRLKNWQARKLLELQDQYQEALDELGLGHKDATRVEDEEEILLEQQESLERIAQERGRAAADRLQIEKNEESLKKAVPVQRKKITRDGENTRSVAVANLGKNRSGKSPGKKRKRNGKQQVFDSDSENQVPQLYGLGEESGGSEVEERRDVVKSSKEQQTSAADFEVPTSDKAAQTLFHDEPIKTNQNPFSLDTRISERIRRRTILNPQVDYCDLVQKESPKKVVFCTCCNCPTKHQDGTDPHPNIVADKNYTRKEVESTVPEKSETTLKGTRNSRTEIEPGEAEKSQTTLKGDRNMSRSEVPQRSDSSLKGDRISDKTGEKHTSQPSSDKNKTGAKSKSEIPQRPKITLRSSKERPAQITTEPIKPVQFYDHPNRFSKSYLPKSSLIEKIDEDNIVISPNVSEDEIREKMRQRDIEAHIRGQVALEKEKMQREYRELLRKLPALQKQERICEIGSDKEKYHMSKDRLEEMEKKRQNRLDNAYEELFVRRKPATVTIPRRQNEEEEPQSLNLASWDVDFEPADTEKSRTDQLSRLLSNLKSQKDSLLKEIENTLSKETVSHLAKSSREDVKSKSTDFPRVKTKRKRSGEERPPSPSSSEIGEEEQSAKSKSSRKGTTISTTETATASSPSPRKKPKLKPSSRKVLVLQNTSTQTTPKTEQSAATSPLAPSTQTDPSCTCKKDASLDELCEIVIKIKEDEKPEVTVNPPFLGKSVRVVTEAEESRESPKESSKDSGLWKQQLSHSSSHSSTSTSYYDPPNTTRSDRQKGVVKVGDAKRREEVSRSLDSTSSTNKSRKQLDPRLLVYIKKLLNMSRNSIDELTVSAASDVSTPTPSVVETPTNNPLLQLLNVMKYFDLDAAELQKQLSYASDDSGRHYNSSASVTVSTSTSDGERFKSCTEVDSGGKIDKKVQESNKKLLQYADIAASCSKKISNLTAMIEKVRAEKKKMLQSSPSSSDDKDLTTTSYLQLPDKKQANGTDEKDLTTTAYMRLPDKKQTEKDVSNSSEEDLGKKLLTIDYDYAEKLKQLSREEIESEKKRTQEEQPTDQELLEKLKALLQGNQDKPQRKKDLGQDIKEGRTVGFSSEKKYLHEDKHGGSLGLTSTRTLQQASTKGLAAETIKVTLKSPTKPDKPHSPPLFLDIPKLPRLETPSLNKKKRPPPTKAPRAIPSAAAPHELSTIIEADSQLSTKADSPLKPKPTPSTSKSDSVPDILAEASHKDAKSTTSEDISEMDTMETMLTSIGMEWAIPTLKKTREALALASSSSGSKESGEMSLREFLSKISTSSSKSEEGLSGRSDQGMSLIQLDNRRTSTPIAEKEGAKEGQPVFLTDSDISSVKEHSNRDKESSEKFYDLNEGSLSKTG